VEAQDVVDSRYLWMPLEIGTESLPGRAPALGDRREDGESLTYKLVWASSMGAAQVAAGATTIRGAT